MQCLVNCRVRGISNRFIKARTVKSDPYCEVLSNLEYLVCREQFSESNSHKSNNEVDITNICYFLPCLVFLYSQVF